MKKGFLKVAALSLVTLLTFSACGANKQDGEPEKDPKEVVKEGLVNLGDAKSANYELSIDGSGSDVDGGTGTFNLALSGVYNNSERDNPEFSVNVEMEAEMSEIAKQSAKAELRIVGGSIYLIVNELSDFEGALPKELVSAYVGQWWSMVLPPELKDVVGSYTGDESQMSEEEKKMKELFESADFFTNLTFDGVEAVGGSDAYKYTADLNNDEIVAYMEAFSASQGGLMTDGDLNDLKDTLELINFNGSIWVGVDDMTFRMVAGDLIVSPKEEGGESANFSFSYGVSDLNGDLHVEAPADAKEFDPLSLMMGMSGGLGDTQF